ncbi:hypothetical protein ABT001_32110 [Streptomyces sp. NPDC002793]|uniref:hypothetical protein n=1 Tax=Streptomyces sp. NPDC002793 TaxID=3154432 RepID=UPI00331B98EF
MKPQFFPDQLSSWLGLKLAAEGHAAGILFPQIVPDAEPALIPGSRRVSADDFFTASTEDRYPDVFGLLPAETPSKDLADRLAQLPRQALTMSHDIEASTAVLVKAAENLI